MRPALPIPTPAKAAAAPGGRTERTPAGDWSALAGVHPVIGAALLAGSGGTILPGSWQWQLLRLWRWWTGEMRALGWGRGADPGRGEIGSGARIPPATLVLPPDLSLGGTLALDPHAIGLASELVAVEAEALTPFALGDMVVAWRVAAVDRAPVVAYRLAPLAALARAGEAAGLTPETTDVVRLESGDGAFAIRVPAAVDTPHAGERRRLAVERGAAALALALITAMVLLLPLQARRAKLEAMEAELARARVALAPALRRLAQDRARQAEDAAALAARAQAPLVSEALRRLTERLDDSVHLDRLSMEAGTLTVSGAAPDAAALIPGLEADPAFADVRLSAPVSFDPADQRQRFELSMRFEPTARWAPTRGGEP